MKLKRIAGAVALASAAAVTVPMASAMANPSQTGDATVVVSVSGGSGPFLSIPDNGSASVYYHGAWQSIDAVNPNNHAMVRADLEPGTYTFAATYNGTRQQKVQTIKSGSNGVYFNAAFVTGSLNDHWGNALTADKFDFYAGDWKDMSNGAWMLPGNYSFDAVYNGTRQQFNGVTVAQPNPNNGADRYQSVDFKTTQVVVMTQVAKCGSNSTAGFVTGNPAYYAGGWHDITTVNSNNHAMRTAEMLPGAWTFGDSVTDSNILGGHVQRSVTVGDGPVQGVYFTFARTLDWCAANAG